MFRSNPKIQLDDKGGLGFNVRLSETVCKAGKAKK
jgi:hypothetical protein